MKYVVITRYHYNKSVGTAKNLEVIRIIALLRIGVFIVAANLQQIASEGL